MAALTERVFSRLARLRHDRALHPHGVVTRGLWTVADPNSALGRVSGPGPTPAVVRLSRGLGLPPPLPDVHGAGVRLDVARRRVDLLFSGSRRVMSTLLPYRTPLGLVVLGLRRQSDHAFQIGERSLAGRWRAVGRLELGAAGEDDETPFDPYLHQHPDLTPVRFLAGLREAAYRGSRRGRA